jgi:hypothetical protein
MSTRRRTAVRLAATLRRGVMFVVMRIVCGGLCNRENTAQQNGAHQRVAQLHCVLPQKDLDRKRPSAGNLAHIVNGFQTAGTRCGI